MARIEAVELVAYGLKCDNTHCDTLVPTRNSTSKVQGYYLAGFERVGDSGYSAKAKEELFFCSKECLVEAMKWQISRLVD